MAAAVDPIEADKVYDIAQAKGVNIISILTTHSHWDHAGGNEALCNLILEKEKRQIQVIGGFDDNVEAVTKEVKHDDVVDVGHLRIHVLYVPCHTRGHVLYYCQDVLFTGDTLFIAGCGRFNNGTPEQMHYNLNSVIANLPHETKIYCGHEYTVNNLLFALHVEPDNESIQRKLLWARQQEACQRPTIPSTIKDELETNPFMRVDINTVQKFAQRTDLVDVMKVLRTAKNNFKVSQGNKL